MHLDPFGKERNSAGYYANKQGTVPVSPFYSSRVKVAPKAVETNIYTCQRERERQRETWTWDLCEYIYHTVYIPMPRRRFAL